jgi:hypothetical protein
MKSINTKSLRCIAETLKKRIRQWKYYLPIINLAFFIGVAVLAIICVLLICYPEGNKIKPEHYTEKIAIQENQLPSSHREIRPIDYYEAVLSRNPFSPDRTAWITPEVKDHENRYEEEREFAQEISREKPAERPAKITLQGILVFGGTRKALIENPDKTGNKKLFIFVEEGEEIAGYRVKHIESDLIKLDWYGEEQVVVMRPNLR